MTLSINSITNICHDADFHYAGCHVLFNVILNVIMLIVIMLNVVMLSVVAPKDFPLFINHRAPSTEVGLLNISPTEEAQQSVTTIKSAIIMNFGST